MPLGLGLPSSGYIHSAVAGLMMLCTARFAVNPPWRTCSCARNQCRSVRRTNHGVGKSQPCDGIAHSLATPSGGIEGLPIEAVAKDFVGGADELDFEGAHVLRPSRGVGNRGQVPDARIA